MNRPWKIWLAFALCAALVLGAMGWTSRAVLRLDRQQWRNDRQAEFEERVRLALWRMDSAVLPLLVEESARPPSAYQPFSAAPRAYTKSYARLDRGDVLVPSPLLTFEPDLILLHFQLDEAGALSSPQAPQGNERDVAEMSYTTGQRIQEAEARLARLRGILDRPLSPDARPANAPDSMRNADLLFHVRERDFEADGGGTGTSAGATRSAASSSGRAAAREGARDSEEWRARSSVFRQARRTVVENAAGLDAAPSDVQGPGVAPVESVFKPIWVDAELLWVRRVSSPAGVVAQGCWLNWPRLQKRLLGAVHDLFPNANLQPARAALAGANSRRLASLPVGLETARAAADQPLGWTPVRISLLVAWICVGLAALAAGLLLHGAVSLSERRGAFVSAVTHELRTPLTTFQLYSEMLADGAVSSEARRRECLRTLCDEARRLGHLVENVLAYARLERGAKRPREESLLGVDLVRRARERLVQRAGQAGLRWVERVDPAFEKITLRTDVAVVEQILFNLVDNACKYSAADGHPREVRLEVDFEAPSRALFRIRDYGPGISPATARRLFQPFSKSAVEAAHSAPGVGLGLALCRRLSRSLRGDLTWDASFDRGACFALSLPAERIG